MTYEHINKFAERVGKTGRTIYRFYNKHVELQEETKKKDGKRLIPINHKKYWNAEILFDENKILIDDNRMMRNLLDYLQENKNPLANKFWGMDWTLFVSIDYKHERNKTYCFTMMSRLYELLEKKYGDKTILRMFFVTEPFSNRNNGQHNHLTIYVEEKNLIPKILTSIKQFFKHDRVDSMPYTKYKGGLFYMLKEGSKGDDWDILGNNLINEGKQYENKGYKTAV